MNKKIGIFGGTFNPVHHGHLLAARAARESLGLDEVLFIPCAKPALKSARGLMPDDLRLRLLKLALKDHPGLRVDARELKRGGKSYTVDTVRELKALAGVEREYYLLIGRDAALEFSRWKDAGELARLCAITVLDRAGESARRESIPKALLRAYRMTVLPIPLADISSTQIRKRLAEGRPISWLVPDAVEKLLLKNPTDLP